MRMEGSVQLQLSAKSVGSVSVICLDFLFTYSFNSLFEAFYNSIKPVNLVLQTATIAPPGKVKVCC